MKKKIFYILLIIIMSQGLGARISMAAIENYSLLEPLPCIEGTGNGCEGGTVKNVNVNTYIAYAFKIAIAMAGFLAVVMVIYGGFKYMLSESITSKGDAKSTINNAILGLLGALASYLILQTIDPRLVEINTTIPKIAIKNDGTVDSFVNQLSSDIRNLASKDRDNVSKIQQEIDNLEVKKSEIDNKIAKGEGNIEDLNLEKYNIENEIKNKKAEQIKVTSFSLGGVYFQLAYDTINKDDRTQDNLNNVLQTYKDTINNSLNMYKNEMNKLQNADSARDIDMTRQFYLDQITNEVEFAKKVKDIQNNTIQSQGSLEIIRSERASLQKFLEDYKNPTNDPLYQKYKNYPDILSRYEQLQETRAARAKVALGIN